MPNRCPGQISWHYDRTEIIADGVVHAIGVCLGLIGAGTIVVMAVKIERVDVAPIFVYVIGLVTMLAFSATAPQARSNRSTLSAKRSAFWNGARSKNLSQCACAIGSRASQSNREDTHENRGLI